MLILTRRIQECLIIDNDIEVRILGVKGNQVRIGITAPQQVTVHREEIQHKINAQKEGEAQHVQSDTKIIYRNVNRLKSAG